MPEPLLRGTTDYADCGTCPFSVNGEPRRPVVSEFPDQPKWILIGEGPGSTETRQLRPFVGPTGSVVNQLLQKLGIDRNELYVGNATCCQPPFGSPEGDRDKAAACCKPRMVNELAAFPNVPILTLGAVAARSVIPKATLDAIDPPDAPKSKKRSHKDRAKAERKLEERRDKSIAKFAKKRLGELVRYTRGQIIDEIRQTHRRRPDREYIERELDRVYDKLAEKADADAILLYETDFNAKEIKRRLKPKKKKPIKMTDIMSATFDVDVDGTGKRYLIPAIHPAALLRGGGATIGGTHTPDLAYVNLMYDVLKIRSLAEGKDIHLHFDVEMEWQDQSKAIRLFIDLLHEAIEEDEVAIDLETYVDDPERHHALMAYMARIRALGLSTSKRAISIHWDLLPPWCLSYFQAMFPMIKTTYHNGLYDRTVLRAHGFQLDNQRWECTLLQHHAAFSGCSHRLQQVTTQFFAVQPWKSEFRNSVEETPEQLHLYNGQDTFATRALRPVLEKLVKRNNVERVHARDLAMAEIASHMHLNGIPISREANTELLNTFSKLAIESRREVEAAANNPKTKDAIHHFIALSQAAKKRKADSDDFETRYNARLSTIRTDPKWRWKINNSKHIAALLQGTGASLTRMTKGGEISTKKEILEELVHVPIVRKILTFRENDKVLSTFVWPIFDREVNGEIVLYGFADDNDRVHSIWSIHKISGRWASSEPVESNQTKPKYKTIEGKSVLVRPSTKTQIVAPRGRKFVYFDFSQIEARVIALISGDPFLLQIFAQGLDIHTECARVIFNGQKGSKTYDQLADPTITMPDGTIVIPKRSKAQTAARNVTKNVEYGTFYGASDETLWKTLLKDGFDVKLADVAQSKQTLMRKMAGVVKWQADTIRRASTPPYQLRDFVDGRIRQWPMGQVEATEALNIVPQMTGAAIMNTGFERMNLRLRKYKEAFPIVQVHDSSAFECWAEDAEAIEKDMNECFPQEYESNGVVIPFPIEGGITDCLAKG